MDTDGQGWMGMDGNGWGWIGIKYGFLFEVDRKLGQESKTQYYKTS